MSCSLRLAQGTTSPLLGRCEFVSIVHSGLASLSYKAFRGCQPITRRKQRPDPGRGWRSMPEADVEGMRARSRPQVVPGGTGCRVRNRSWLR